MTISDSAPQRIAFIGLGEMGAPMALNLEKAGHTVSAFDLGATAREQTASRSFPIAASVAAAVDGATVVISMLPAARHVEALYLGSGSTPGLLRGLPKECVVIDCSTIAPGAARRISEAATWGGLAMLDAPACGAPESAASGTLTFMVGGEAEAFERARSVLQAMGDKLFHAGPAGAGQAAKICNNMLMGILMIGTSEALALGLANGLDPRILSQIMRCGSAANWALEHCNPLPGVMEGTPASRGYAEGFSTDLMLKDLGLAMELASRAGVTTPLGSLARHIYSMHSAGGGSSKDFSSIVQQFSKLP